MAGKKSAVAHAEVSADFDDDVQIEDLNALPDDEPSQLKLAKWLTDDIHRAVMAQDISAANKAVEQRDALARKANGGTNLGVEAGPDAPGPRIGRHCAAAPGAVPGWGQCGEYLATVNGMRVLVQVTARADEIAPHLEFHVVDVDRPFLSNTGYRSHFMREPGWGRELAEVVAEVIAGHRRVPIDPGVQPPALPAWAESVTPAPRRAAEPISYANLAASNDAEPDMENPGLGGCTIPTTRIDTELTAGSPQALKSTARQPDDFIMLPLDRLAVMEDFNIRVQSPEYRARVRALANDMLANGFRIDKPITIYILRKEDGTDSPIVTDGHTRLAAAKLANSEGAGIAEVPVAIESTLRSMDDLLFGLDEANSGTQLTMLEKALLVQRLINRGVSDVEIMRRRQMTAPALDNLVTLGRAPEAVQMMVAANQVAGTHVVNLIRRHGVNRAGQILEAQLAKAQAAGKTKVTAGTSPMARYESKVKRSGPALLSAAEAIRTDPGYSALAAENRDRLDQLIAELEKLRPAETPA